MNSYTVGTQDWYDATRARLIAISKKLRSPETNQAEKERLYDEQTKLIDDLSEHATEEFVNTPMV